MGAMPYAAGDVLKVKVLILIEGTDVPTHIGDFHVNVLRTGSAQEAIDAGAVPEESLEPQGAIAIHPNEVSSGLVSIAREIRRMGER